MVAAYCALLRPDVFRSLVIMSFPFDGPPDIPFGTDDRPPVAAPPSLDAALAALSPPRLDSMAFFSSRGAEADMLHPSAGAARLSPRLLPTQERELARQPPAPARQRLGGRAGDAAALLHHWTRDAGMAAAVAPDMPSPAEVAANRWLSDADLAVYVEAIRRNGLQGKPELVPLPDG